MKKSFLISTLLFSMLLSACGGKTPSSNNGSDITSGDTTQSSVTTGGDTTPISIPDYDANWQGLDFSTYGETFRNKLASLINGHGTKTAPFNGSNNDTLHVGARAAAYPNENSNTFVPFYHSTAVTATIGSCNREHTWPDSRGGGLIENDPFIIRPTLTKDNSTRGNNFYGNEKSNEFDPMSIENYAPARGESARVTLYAACRYASKGLSLSNNPNDDKTLKTLGTLKTLLKWNLQYAPTAIEIQINNYLDKQGYGRNPFVDHPEYAKFIWNYDGVLDHFPTNADFDQDAPASSTKKYNLVSSIDQLDGKTLAIVSAFSSSSQYYGMTATNASDSLPWYFTSVQATISSDKKEMSCASNSLEFFKFQKQSDGSFTIFSETRNKYLYSYISESHYSICMDTSVKHDNDFSTKWNLTASNGGFIFKSDLNVYLTCSQKSTFAGNINAPTVPIYLYQ